MRRRLKGREKSLVCPESKETNENAIRKGELLTEKARGKRIVARWSLKLIVNRRERDTKLVANSPQRLRRGSKQGKMGKTGGENLTRRTSQER